MPSFRVTIDGYPPNNEYVGFPDGVYVLTKSLVISQTYKARTVCQFTLIDRLSINFHWTELIGRKIDVWEYISGDAYDIDSWSCIFSGQLDEPETRNINKGIFSNEIICIDHHAICDRICVNQTYPKIYIHELIMLIIDDYLTDDGIWYDLDSIQETMKEVKIVCPYVFCTQIFDELADLLNWKWEIRADKKFFFNDGSGCIGQSLIEDQGYASRTLRIIPDRKDFRTVQIIKDVPVLINSILEIATPYPNDAVQEFKVTWPIEAKPRIFVTTWANKSHPLADEEVLPEDIGIYGLDQSGTYKWYWTKGSAYVYQDGGEVPPSINNYVVVDYIPQLTFDIIRYADNVINERKAIEGGSGIYTNVMNGSNIYGEDIAEDVGDALLDRYARIAKKIKFNTFDKYYVGNIGDVILPSYNINSLVSAGQGYLVYGVTIRDNGTPELQRSVELIDGEPLQGWINFFKQWISKENYFEIRTDLIVNISFSQRELIEYEESLNVLRLDPLYPDIALWPDINLWPGTQISSHNYP